MVDYLRTKMAGVDKMDPDGEPYKKLCKILDNATPEALRVVFAAKIKFVSNLALNRLIRQGLT